MTWPAVQVKTNFDAAGDDPKSARSEFAGNVDKFNQLQAHVSSYVQGLLDDADAGAARTTLGLVIGTDVQALDATLTSLAAVAGVAGDILYASGTDAWARLAKGTDGEALVLASGIPSWEIAGATIVTKTADETVNNSSTLQDDDHLLFALAANTTYWFEMYLLLDIANTTPDFKFGWTVPASCVMFWETDWSTNSSGQLKGEGETITHSITTGVGNHAFTIRGFVRNGANAGNMQMQWAQNSADASDCKILKHSLLTIRNLGAT